MDTATLSSTNNSSDDDNDYSAVVAYHPEDLVAKAPAVVTQTSPPIATTPASANKTKAPVVAEHVVLTNDTTMLLVNKTSEDSAQWGVATVAPNVNDHNSQSQAASSKPPPKLAPPPACAVTTAVAQAANNNSHGIPPMPPGVPRGRGAQVPPLSDESCIPYLTENNNQRLQKGWIHILPQEVPEDLRDLDSPRWKDGKYLLSTFTAYNRKSEKRTRAKIQIPLCLLLSAKTFQDRLTVVNFWLSHSKENQTKMIRNREEGLLRYYMQLKDTRENTFRQAYISGPPLQQKRKAQLLEEQLQTTLPIVPRHVDEKRVVQVDEHSTCLDYMLRTSLLCIPCDQFRQRFLPPCHRSFVDVWPLYRARRQEIVTNASVNTDDQYTCQQLFDTTREVGRGVGHKKRRVVDFIQDHRILQKSESLQAYEKKRLARPCFGLSGEAFRCLILQASEQANRLAVIRDEVIPDTFPLPDCYKNRNGFECVIVRKEERLVKVYSRRRNRNGCKEANETGNEAKLTDTTTEDGNQAAGTAAPTKEPLTAMRERLAVATGKQHQVAAGSPQEPESAGEGAAKAAVESPYNAEDDGPEIDVGKSTHHYVIRSKNCAGEVDTQKGHKLCKACTDAAVMVRSVARDASRDLNLSKGAALTKLDVAKLITSPELIEDTIRMLRAQRAKDLKMCRKELQRLRDRTGITKQNRRKAGSLSYAPARTNGVDPPQLPTVAAEEQPVPPLQMNMAEYRRYSFHREAEQDHDVVDAVYDSDDLAAPDELPYRRPAVPTLRTAAGHTRVLPRGSFSPSKRTRHHY